jgi:hypothetical protein
MSWTAWQHCIRQWLRPSPQVRHARPRRLRLETLEDRTTPTAFAFSTGAPDGLIGSASRPPSTGVLENETGDDFILNTETSLTSATFTGLLPANTPASNINDVNVEIYRVFPKDSTNPPSGHVPARTNSPSDVQFDNRDSAADQLSFTTALVAQNFTVMNSVVTGIHPVPNQTTGGEGPVTGEEVTFTVTFATPLILPADHYFFVPQVGLTNGTFLWLSAPKPTNPPLFTGDLQAWTRNSNLDPDWLRIGTDIVGGSPAPTFNMSFSLAGQTVAPQLSSLSPPTVAAGSPATTLTLMGSDFTQGSLAQLNGQPLVTTFLNNSQLQAIVPTATLASTGNSGTIQVLETNAAPSASVAFTIAGPQLSSLSPATAAVGSPALTVSVNGTNFASSAVVDVNGTPVATTFVSSSLLQALLPASLFAQPADGSSGPLGSSGSALALTVTEGNATSNALSFTVGGPTLSSLSQTSVLEGSGSLTLTVTGTNFVNNSVVERNGVALRTTFLSSTQLQAIVPAALLVHEGSEAIQVSNAAGILSNTLAFSVREATPTATGKLTSFVATRGHTKVTIQGTYSDAVAEGHRVRINWGDGTTTLTSLGTHKRGNFALSHTYRKLKAHTTALVTVLDDVGKASTRISVPIVPPVRHHGQKT